MTWNVSTPKTIKADYERYLANPDDPLNWFSSSDKTKWPPYRVLQICFEVYRATPRWHKMRERCMAEHGDFCWWSGVTNPEYHHWAYPVNAWTNCWAEDNPDLIVPLCDEYHEFLEEPPIKKLIDDVIGKAYFRTHRKTEYFDLMIMIFSLKDNGHDALETANEIMSTADA